jgi:site-specific DNA-methyltransferase (adenine-specific)
VNPPYGNEIVKWVRRGYEEAMRGKTVVLVVPSRTDTAWWHAYVMRADEIRFIRGRLHFDEHVTGTPFPSCVVVWRKELRAPVDHEEYVMPVEWEE